MDFTTIEQEEGIRFTWNQFPTSRLHAAQNIIPLSMLYTPFMTKEEPTLRTQTQPLLCSGCRWAANPYCSYDYTMMKWDCVNCGQRSPLPSVYKDYIAEGYSIPEFENQNTTIEFQNSKSIEDHRPVLFFVVDTCVYENELAKVKEELLKSLEGLVDVNVALITLGKHVFIHDLSSDFLSQVVVNGSIEYKREKLLELLHLKSSNSFNFNFNKFVQPVSKCKEKLLKIVRKIKGNRFGKGKDERAQRAVGQALFTASVVIQAFGGHGGRIVTFLGGPCTFGPGMIISHKLTDTFRNHDDLEKDSNKITSFNAARKFYDEILEKCVTYGITIDLFAFTLVQFGCAEMKNLIFKTGGIIANQEEFTNQVFEKTLKKYFEMLTDESVVYNAQMKILNSKEIFISGALGPMKLVSKSDAVPKDAEGLIGEAGGNEFFVGASLNTSTYCVFYSHTNAEVNIKSKPCYFQIQTRYVNSAGETITRIATFMREFVNDPKTILNGFDQESAIASIARLTTFKGENIDVVDLVYWLNSVLIKFVRRFANYTKGLKSSFKVPEEISLIPQFMFYFRKSFFVQKFGISVDESAFYKMMLNRETLSNMLVMIQPALFSYDLDTQQPTPVLCDMESLKPDIVLLVDTYFNVLIWQGAQIHGWIKEEYHLMEEYEHLQMLIDQPNEDATLIVEDRLPVPNVVDCYPGSPTERLLKSKLNPASVQNTNTAYQQDENYITDDVNLKTFMDYLISLVVKKD